ncbi:MAG: cytochrome c biogenesis protein CcsA [Gemmataceae bacterium]
MLTRKQRQAGLIGLGVLAGVMGVCIIAFTYVVFRPIFTTSYEQPAETPRLALPAYDYKPFHELPVQAGRTKPFETAAIETVRNITGRSKFEKHDPVALVLMWQLGRETINGPATFDWENYPFILCDHHGLRELIYKTQIPAGGELSEAQRHGKYVSPADLRNSPELVRLLKEAEEKHRQYRDRASQYMTPEQRKAEEVVGRLSAFDRVQGKLATRLGVGSVRVGGMVFTGEQLEDKALELDTTIEQVVEQLENRVSKHPDPFHYVALDRVPYSAWFSIGELQRCQNNREHWEELMRDRLSDKPQLYISPERQADLRRFQERIKAKQGQNAIEELASKLEERRKQILAEIQQADADKDGNMVFTLVERQIRSKADRDRLTQAIRAAQQSNLNLQEAVLKELHKLLQENDAQLIEQLRDQVRQAEMAHYHPDQPEYRMLHLDYLEALHPTLYRESTAWQKVPRDQIEQVLNSFADLEVAYKAGNAEEFSQAAQQFFATVRNVSNQTLFTGLAERHPTAAVQAAHAQLEAAFAANDSSQIESAQAAFVSALKNEGVRVDPYPGVSTLPLELTFNRVQPFMWAWIIMLLAMVMFIANLAVPSRFLYVSGFVLFIVSLLFQIFGFTARVMISGRPPVSNMYETVIWVAFVSAIFALVLELIYRKRVIALAGAAVATLGLVLADQLPLALDPSISPLNPVLRSNYWLIIHVLTIVSSYAGGTLAWGLANITLIMLVFGRGSPDTLKTLSLYTYRAIQIAVLLLAAGTFLGGWWAADSWGRFWGWDPKEVWALIALVCYVIPLHMRYIGWVKDFGLAVAAILCYSSIVMCWYGVNFVLGAGLHSYGFGGGGPMWVFWAGLLNIGWVVVASMIYLAKQPTVDAAG